MTLGNPTEFYRSTPASFDGYWDFSVLDECFDYIGMTDIDGLRETNGNFLCIETKNPGVEVPYGQMKTFKQLIETGRFTIIIVEGKPGVSPVTKITVMYPDGKIRVRTPGVDSLKSICRNWNSWAKKQSMSPEQPLTVFWDILTREFSCDIIDGR